LIDKPLTWTSFDVANKLKRACKFKKIGHAGTLDPLATGLLILCTGKKTKQIDTYQAQEKEYTGTMILGKTTPSIDLETEFDAEYPTDHITPEVLEKRGSKLTGHIEQVPPIYSAVKLTVSGFTKKRGAARRPKSKRGMSPIKLFEIDTTHFPSVDFRIICSKGTYIRSMVRDFGELAGSGAYMSAVQDKDRSF
jgi:tRNA pseudouridine55 synthase